MKIKYILSLDKDPILITSIEEIILNKHNLQATQKKKNEGKTGDMCEKGVAIKYGIKRIDSFGCHIWISYMYTRDNICLLHEFDYIFLQLLLIIILLEGNCDSD